MFRARGWKQLSRPPAPPAGGEVHLWLLDLERRGDRDLSLLSDRERQRAGRYRDPGDRGRFIAARGQLRQILGGYTGIPAAALAFRYGPQGKPALVSGGPAFNLSHAGGQGLLGITAAADIGVDIEPLRRRENALALARRVFGDATARTLERLPRERLDRAFLRRWTRLEACAKARGEGIFRDAGSGVPVISFQPAGGWIAAVAMLPRVPPGSAWQLFRYLPPAPGRRRR